MLKRRHTTPPSSSPARFQPLSLASVLMTLIGRRRSRAHPRPSPDWERDEPMTGLS